MHPFLSCQIAVQVFPYPSRVFTPPSHLLLLCVTAGASQARPETIEPLGTQPRLQVVAVDTGQQGAFLEEDLAALVSGGRALIRTGDCSTRDKYLSSLSVKDVFDAMQASRTQSHLKTFQYLHVMKKIA